MLRLVVFSAGVPVDPVGLVLLAVIVLLVGGAGTFAYLKARTPKKPKAPKPPNKKSLMN